MNFRDHHDIPFALLLVMAALTGFIIGFTILYFIGNEKPVGEGAKQPLDKRD